jgi:hypothetical protein
MFRPTWPSPAKYKNIENAGAVNYNIKFYEMKWDLIFT